METINDVWDGDFFDRKAEAEALIGYLESVVTRPSIRDQGQAHVLAVDTSYGQGKSFFLRRLARHMKVDDHAVAFVDAWVDDLEDQPLVALVATLDAQGTSDRGAMNLLPLSGLICVGGPRSIHSSASAASMFSWLN